MAFVRNVVIQLTIATVAFCLNDLGMNCQGKSDSEDTFICTDKPTDYDIHEPKMQDIVEQSKNWKGFQKGEYDDFEDDETPIFDPQNCDAIPSVKKPFVIIRNKTENYVVQIKGFEQRIRITECYNPDAACFDGVIKNDEFSTACKPKEATISLYVYDRNTDKIVYQPFSLPVACTCMMSSK